jgi:glycosyltransferase involved in cell wall biosynthesis
MARIGNNPFKNNVKVGHTPDLSLCVVTHYTHDPYHEHRMEIVSLCLESLLAGCKGINYELIIWDNESTPEFRAMLGRYRPTVFIQSVNIGAHSARHAMTEAASAPIICQTDDDILFSADWLHMQLEILTTFPNVGLVSGSPQRTGFRAGISSNLKWAESEPEAHVRTGKLIPDEWERDFCASVGRNWDKHKANPMWQMLQDTQIEYKGVTAWAHGHHMQFLAYRDTIAPFITRLPVMLDNKKLFNIPVDEAGYLQLTTLKRTAVHIGNVIDPSIVKIWDEWKVRE